MERGGASGDALAGLHQEKPTRHEEKAAERRALPEDKGGRCRP